CLPVTQEVAGSSPVRTAINVNETIMFSFFLCFLLLYLLLGVIAKLSLYREHLGYSSKIR
ncbi:hypothetical protein V5N19_15355, partial [Bacillus subtilis]|uniref:hypothetical protein n=1 Tax=Bacillus subtilis TaxID=1423 RepID=UPI003000BE28